MSGKKGGEGKRGRGSEAARRARPGWMVIASSRGLDHFGDYALIERREGRPTSAAEGARGRDGDVAAVADRAARIAASRVARPILLSFPRGVTDLESKEIRIDRRAVPDVVIIFVSVFFFSDNESNFFFF